MELSTVRHMTVILLYKVVYIKIINQFAVFNPSSKPNQGPIFIY